MPSCDDNDGGGDGDDGVMLVMVTTKMVRVQWSCM
jgi:hypothetical protein